MFDRLTLQTKSTTKSIRRFGGCFGCCVFVFSGDPFQLFQRYTCAERCMYPCRMMYSLPQVKAPGSAHQWHYAELNFLALSWTLVKIFNGRSLQDLRMIRRGPQRARSPTIQNTQLPSTGGRSLRNSNPVDANQVLRLPWDSLGPLSQLAVRLPGSSPSSLSPRAPRLLRSTSRTTRVHVQRLSVLHTNFERRL